jgi:NhaA family Na+:H+ antiporter
MTQSDGSFIKHFLKQESAGGIILVFAGALAMVLANSPLVSFYNLLIDTPVAVQVGALKLAKPLLLWVNDGFMAVFFLLAGLEFKREFLEGELSDYRNVILPGLGAVGSMAVPALIYILLIPTIRWRSAVGRFPLRQISPLP